MGQALPVGAHTVHAEGAPLTSEPNGFGARRALADLNNAAPRGADGALMLEAAEGEGPAARTEPGLRARGGPPFDTCADRGAVAWRNHRRATSPRPPRPGVGPRADRTAWCRTGAGAGAPSPCAGRVGLHIAEPSPARPVIQRNRLATGEWVEMEVEAQAVVSRAMPYISANAPSAARARSSFVHVSRALASSSGQVGVAVGQPEVAQVDEPRHLQGLRVEDDVGQAKAPAADDGVGGLLVPSPRDLRGEAGQQLRRSRVLLLKGGRTSGVTASRVTTSRATATIASSLGGTGTATRVRRAAGGPRPRCVPRRLAGPRRTPGQRVRRRRHWPPGRHPRHRSASRGPGVPLCPGRPATRPGRARPSGWPRTHLTYRATSIVQKTAALDSPAVTGSQSPSAPSAPSSTGDTV